MLCTSHVVSQYLLVLRKKFQPTSTHGKFAHSSVSMTTPKNQIPSFLPSFSDKFANFGARNLKLVPNEHAYEALGKSLKICKIAHLHIHEKTYIHNFLYINFKTNYCKFSGKLQ